MIFQQIINSKEEKNGHIRHDLASGEQRFYRAIYAGISWPEHPKPNGFYCILGQGREKTPANRFPLTLLAEGQTPNFDSLFKSLGDDTKITSCRAVFADILESKESFRHVFWEDKSLNGLFLQQAPYSENFSLGIQLIKSFVSDKTLDINPDSIVAKQLGGIPVSALGENPEIDYYAVDALRCVVCAFHRWTFEDDKLPDLEMDESTRHDNFLTIDDMTQQAI